MNGLPKSFYIEITIQDSSSENSKGESKVVRSNFNKHLHVDDLEEAFSSALKAAGFCGMEARIE